jgi:ABC-type lipoprotein release transport system permease subunit
VLELAWQTVRRQPGRFAAAAGAVASAVMLVMVAGGLYLGLLDAMLRYVRTLPGEIVVTEKSGTAALFHSSSRLSRDAADTVRGLPGVADAAELYGRLTWLERDGRQALVYLVGVTADSPFAVPVRVVAGKDRPGLAEIVVDEVLARDLALRLGDSLHVGPAELRVVGIAAGGNAVLGSFAFVQRGTLFLTGMEGPSYLFVRVGPELTVAEVLARINIESDLLAISRQEFQDANQALSRQIVLPLIAIVVAVASAVGGTIVALTLYTVAMEHREDYGLMKALGLPSRAVLGAAFAQGGIATGVGVVVGMALGWTVAFAVRVVEPRFVTVTPVWFVASVAGGALLLGALAATVPVRAVARIDPALVFRV